MKATLRRLFLGERPGTSADAGFSDLLPYQSLVADGVILLKDRFGADEHGALLAGWWYRGPDIESAASEAMVSLSLAVNTALKKLDSGWMVHVEAIRVARHVYEPGSFQESVDALIDEERNAGARHYLTECAIFISLAPSALERAGGNALRRVVVGETAEDELGRLERRIAEFEGKLEDVQQVLGNAFAIARMRSTAKNDELLQALNLVVNGRWHPVKAPRSGSDLDCMLARDLLWRPRQMQHGDAHIEVVALMDLPAHSVPGLLHALTQLDTELRWSSRFILMDYGGARSQLKSLEAKWTHKVVPLSSHLFGTQGAADRDALERVDEVQEALADLESGMIRFGHYTSVVVVRATTPAEAAKKAALVVSTLEERGFSAMVESHNQMEAYLGSLPGNRAQNVRKPIIHSLNVADMLPLGREWEGESDCPSPMFPRGSAALLQARSWSGSPFHLNLHQHDLGHTLILGPSGAGKSTLLAVLASQWMRYPRSRVIAFDQGASLAALTMARRDGAFYRVGTEGGPALCPLSDLETDTDRAWAADFIEGLCDAQGTQVTPDMRQRIFEGVVELAESTHGDRDPASRRTLTHLVPHLNDRLLSSALSYYTSGPAAGILNAAGGQFAQARFTTYELEQLLDYDAKTVVPAVMFLLRQVEKSLNDDPMLVLFDEAWRQLSDPLFANRLRAWLKKFRKRNCAVVLATQQLSDVAGSTIGDVVFESCATRILLPNEHATGAMRHLYAEYLRLSDAQIELLTRVERKRWYLYSAGSRSRLFTLDVGPVARAFCGASSPAELSRLWELAAAHGARWPSAWLEERNLAAQARRFEQLEGERALRRLATARRGGAR